MPTNRRRREHRRRGQVGVLTADQRYHLETGLHHFRGLGGDREQFEGAWEEYGEQLLAEWIERHPGTRPFAWWLVEHGEERPLLWDEEPDRVQAMRDDTRRGNTF